MHTRYRLHRLSHLSSISPKNALLARHAMHLVCFLSANIRSISPEIDTPAFQRNLSARTPPGNITQELMHRQL